LLDGRRIGIEEMTDPDAYVAALVAEAPPLTQAQRDQLRDLIRPEAASSRHPTRLNLR